MAQSMEDFNQKLEGLESGFNKKLEGLESMMQQMCDNLSGFGAWRTSADKSFRELLTRYPWHPPPPPPRWQNPFDLNMAPPPEGNVAPHAGTRPPASSGERPHGHHPDLHHRDVGGGVLGPPSPRPVMGMSPEHNLIQFDLGGGSGSNHSRFMPKMDFPMFDGDNPRVWKDRCEAYFEVYGISENLKPKFATLNFTGPAATWLQTGELRGPFQAWEALCAVVCDHYDRDQYQINMSVADYHSKFEQLAHSIMLYNPSYDNVYLVTQFLSGLKEEIRASIALHRPKDLETASTLALLQEQELLRNKKNSAFRTEGREFSKFSSRSAGSVDKDKGRVPFKKDVPRKEDSPPVDEKWAAMKAYRKAHGLCYVCGEKWTGKNHKCPPQVSLSVIHEMMELFQLKEDSEEDSEQDEMGDDEEVVLAVQPALQSTPVTLKKRKTLKFRGFIGKQEVLILLDFGSVSTFLSNKMASLIQQQSTDCEPIRYYAADGQPMVSN
ncbi:hypothetical protein BS78_05G134100 [Paspalum vaginatum]|nr:hypothetical protein BS78_05G134100 [Paspalum vaginatum]